jgi:hypothetical protein
VQAADPEAPALVLQLSPLNGDPPRD